MSVTAQLGEFQLIRRFFARTSAGAPDTPGVLLGIGDDAALLRMPPDADLVAAVDTVVAGRHFPIDSAARSIGHRALAVNLSDLAAMGATPAWATLALTLPHADPDWLEGFSAGLLDLAAVHGVALVGGDTTSGPLTISVQLMGHVPSGTALLRSGARVGDLLAVTGTLGDAGAGLAIVQGSYTPHDSRDAGALVQRFEYPTPRVEFGRAIRGIASAAMDLSDGLTGDLPKLAGASGVGAHVDIERLPLSRAMTQLAAPALARQWALGAGDDYELLVTVPASRRSDIEAVADGLNLRVTVIGEIRPENRVTWALHGQEFTPAGHGYDHFR